MRPVRRPRPVTDPVEGIRKHADGRAAGSRRARIRGPCFRQPLAPFGRDEWCMSEQLGEGHKIARTSLWRAWAPHQLRMCSNEEEGVQRTLPCAIRALARVSSPPPHTQYLRLRGDFKLDHRKTWNPNSLGPPRIEGSARLLGRAGKSKTHNCARAQEHLARRG